MKKEIWIESVLESTNGMTKVAPSNDLFSKIQSKIKNQKVAPKTIWMVAASIMVLVLLNITAIKTQNSSQQETKSIYLSETLIQSNQLYQ
jgi:hypothetical protein